MCPVSDDTRLDAERRALVEAFAPRVAEIARALRRQIDLPAEECESAGYEALTRAALRYDPALGTPFVAFAYYRVRGAMIDAARQRFPDNTRARRLLHVIGVTQELAAIRARGLDDPRGRGERCADAAELIWETTAAALLSRALADDEGLGIEARLTLRAAVERCEPEERALIEAVYVRGLSMSEYAEAQGLSPSTVSRRHARTLQRLGDLFAGRAPRGRAP